eukprot:scaffold7413_cov48-Cylindrotheca_fusiformis.AAC.1
MYALEQRTRLNEKIPLQEGKSLYTKKVLHAKIDNVGEETLKKTRVARVHEEEEEQRNRKGEMTK